MRDLNDKIGDGGATAAGRYAHDESNDVTSELQALIESAGITLSGADLTQHAKAVAELDLLGDYFNCTGIANAYVLSVTGSRIAPPTLKVGMKVRFVPIAVNTGASTLNAFGSGVLSIKREDGTDVGAGDLDLAKFSEATYQTGPDRWVVSVDISENLPYESLDYPTIANADNRMIVTPAAATNGGTISMLAGTKITIGEASGDGETGKIVTAELPAFTSIDLDIEDIDYYLRAKMVTGVLTVYMTKGSDVDVIPAGLVGTIDAVSGGGFDSTVLDILIAKVRTKKVGDTPIVTELANNKRLMLFASLEGDALRALSWTAWPIQPTALDWARTPIIANASLYLTTTQPGKPDGTNIAAGTLQMAGCRLATTSDRYQQDIEYAFDDGAENDGSMGVSLELIA